jgi:hypothetical protein
VIEASFIPSHYGRAAHTGGKLIKDTLKKAENAIVGMAKLLIFHDLESAARNYSVFP